MAPDLFFRTPYLVLPGIAIVQPRDPIGHEYIVQLARGSAQQSRISPEAFGRQWRQVLFDSITEVSLKSPRQHLATANASAASSQPPSP